MELTGSFRQRVFLDFGEGRKLHIEAIGPDHNSITCCGNGRDLVVLKRLSADCVEKSAVCLLCLEFVGIRVLHRTEVPNELLRRAFERSGLTPCQLAWRLGYTKPVKDGRYVAADDAPVKRALGLRPYGRPARSLVKPNRTHHYPARQPTRQKTMRQSTALRYCAALGLDPVDIGL